MKANLRNGKLIPPKSLREGVMRRQLLAREISRIEGQFFDVNRRQNVFVTDAAYKEWKDSAKIAFNLFKREELLLAEWLEVREREVAAVDDSILYAFRGAYELLKKLELEFEFDVDEAEFMKQLDERFEVEDKKQAKG